MRSVLAALLVGLVVGWFNPDLWGRPDAPAEIRTLLSFKIGLAFALLAYILQRWFAARQRFLERMARPQD